VFEIVFEPALFGEHRIPLLARVPSISLQRDFVGDRRLKFFVLLTPSMVK